MEAELKALLPPVNQIGVVVRDCEKAAEFYSRMYGIGPFGIYDTKMQEATLYGEPAPSVLRIGVARMGDLEIELIQVLEGGEFYNESLRTKGEGLHHIGTYIKDLDEYDRTLAEVTKQGIRPSFQYRGRRLKFTYLDTQADHGVIVELMNLEGRP